MKSFWSSNASPTADLRKIQQRAEQLLSRSAVSADSHVKIFKRDQWYVFQGRVSCSGTKAALFTLVPPERGAQWIIDRVHVGRPVPNVDSVG
jgi:hypothetical protein